RVPAEIERCPPLPLASENLVLRAAADGPSVALMPARILAAIGGIDHDLGIDTVLRDPEFHVNAAEAGGDQVVDQHMLTVGNIQFVAEGLHRRPPLGMLARRLHTNILATLEPGR